MKIIPGLPASAILTSHKLALFSNWTYIKRPNSLFSPQFIVPIFSMLIYYTYGKTVELMHYTYLSVLLSTLSFYWSLFESEIVTEEDAQPLF